MQEGPENNLPRWFRRYEIAKMKGSKVLFASGRTKSGSIADVATPVPKIYHSEALSVSLENFPNLNEANVFTIELPIRIQSSRSTSMKIDRADANESPVNRVPFLLWI
jgi:hypothetical protein